MKCPKCQAENPEENKYCGKCGASLSDVTTTLLLPLSEDLPEKLDLDFAPGQYFGKRYQIIEQVGKGGMGRVYKTLDKELNRIVALKMIRPELSVTPSMIKRFKKELVLASKVNHKNVCRIHDLGEAEGIKFISMQYIDGQDLKQFIIQSGKLTEEKAIDITKQICAALQAAHDEGVIHRDLKPQNIVLDKKGNAYVMDFGIAKSLEAEEATRPGVVMGSPAYISPEQAEGKDVDHRTDIYSLGAIMYEMVTGKPLFKADSIAAFIRKHITEVPELPSTLNPNISKAIEGIILKCLEKDPVKRFQKADEIFTALDNVKPELFLSASSYKFRNNSIAVLPFVNLSPQKDQDYFCDGLAEELINSLTKIKDLRVVARTSAFSFKGKKLDIREIGKKLNVHTILEGSVRKSGNKLRITAQLSEVNNGYQIWSERYDREMDDVFAIQDEISLEIVNKLRLKLGGKERSLLFKRYTEDLEAYNLYLRGRYHLNKRTKEGLKKAIEYFEKAIDKNPTYALAYAGIADYYTLLGWFRYLSPKDAFPKAQAAAEKALEMDESLAEARTSLAWVRANYNWAWFAAEKEFKRAIELKPSYAVAHQWFSNYLGAMGRHDESIAEAKRAQELDPLSLYITFNLGNMFYLARQYDDAIEECHKTLEMDANFYVSRIFLPLPYAQKGMFKEATAELNKAKKLVGEETPKIKATRGYIYAISGKKEKAEKLLEELSELAKNTYVSPWTIVAIYAALNQKREAMTWLNKAYEEHDQWLKFLKVEPILDDLRSNLGFKELLRRIGLHDKPS
jgi:serine/threonine protein kinase/Tfp pilus assembly protein PilF